MDNYLLKINLHNTETYETILQNIFIEHSDMFQ